MPQICPYDPALFVNRKQEVDRIAKVAGDLAKGISTQERLCSFTGQRGCGKTWLLRHLKDALEKQWGAQVRTALLDLSKWHDLPDSEDFAREVMAAFALQTDAQAGEVTEKEKAEISLQRWAEWLVHDVRQIASQGHFLAILLDSVYEVGWDRLQLLENVFLGPLVVEPRVLVVIAGRGKPFSWRLPEVWFYGKTQELEPFDKRYVKEMLNNMGVQDEGRVREIYQLSGGYPYITWLLSQYEIVQYPEVLAEALDYLLPSEILEKKGLLDTLFILRSFDEDRIAALVPCDWSEAHEILDDLKEARLTWYELGRRGFILDGAVRHVGEQLLRMKKPQTWRTLHEKARDLYRKWVEQYGKEWDTEMEYHSQVLKKKEV